MHRHLRWVAGTIVALALLFVGASALAFHLVDVDSLVREQVALHQPAIEGALGRKVAFGAIRTRFFPTLGATIEDVRIEAAEGAADAEPLLHVGEAGFSLDLLGALLSGGREVSLSGIHLDGVRVHLVRHEDGSLSIADLLARADEPPTVDEADDGGDPATLELLQRVSIDRFRISGARIELVDRAAPGGARTSVVDQVELRVDDVRLGAEIGVSLRAAAFSDRPNLDLAFAVGPIPADLRIDGLLPIRALRARIDALDLASAGDWLPAEIEAGVVSADLRLPRLAPAEPTSIEGHLAIRGLQFTGGAPVDVRVDADLAADPRSLGVDVEELRLQVGTAELVASGAARDLAEAPRFENLVVRSGGIDPGALLAAFPQLREALPPGARVEGTATVSLRASGTARKQTLDLAVDLGGLDLHLPGLLEKRKGTPFALRVDGDFDAAAATLRNANLRLDELDVDLHGTVRDFAAPTYDFVLAAKPFSLDRLARLVPEAAAQMQAADVRASGRGTLSGHLKGGQGAISANLDFAMREMELDLPDATLRGAVEARFFASGDPAGRMQAGLRVDAGDSVIRIPGLLHKDAETPLAVDVVAEKTGERISFSKFDARLANLALRARGALGPGDAALDVELPRVDLGALARTLPALPAERLRDASLEGALRVQGDPAAPATLRAELKRFALQLGGSDLQATGTVADLEAPRVEVQLTSRMLDLDALLPEEEKADAATEKEAEREDDPALKAIHAVARFDLARVRLRDRLLEDVRGRLVLEDGVLRIEQADFRLYGGTVRAAGTEVAIWRGAMPFRARLDAKGVDVARLLAGESGKPSMLAGKGNLEVDLAGAGFDLASLEQHLSGGWSLGLTEGRLLLGDVTSAVAGGLAKVPGVDPQRLASAGELRDLLASFIVEKGRMNLQRPIALRLDGNRVELGGAVGVAGGLFLDGNYFVGPTAVQRLSGGRCSLDQEAAVPLRIGGTIRDPAVQPDAAALAGVLARSCLAGEARDAVDRLTGGAATEAIGDARAKAEEAAAEARRQAEETRTAAARKAEEAKAAAEKAKREAEQKAKDEAKKKADDLRKRLGF